MAPFSVAAEPDCTTTVAPAPAAQASRSHIRLSIPYSHRPTGFGSARHQDQFGTAFFGLRRRNDKQRWNVFRKADGHVDVLRTQGLLDELRVRNPGLGTVYHDE